MFGIGKQQDLPPIPDAPVGGTPKTKQTPSSVKRVTFSPAKEYIPEYEFTVQQPKNGPNTPCKLIRELQEICPNDCSDQLMKLAKLVEDLKDELSDLQQENARLVKENKILKGEEQSKR